MERDIMVIQFTVHRVKEETTFGGTICQEDAVARKHCTSEQEASLLQVCVSFMFVWMSDDAGLGDWPMLLDCFCKTNVHS